MIEHGRSACRKAVLFTVLAAVAAGLAPSARAQSDSPLWEKWGVTLGGFYNSADSRMRLDAGSGNAHVGTNLDLEKDLGLKASKTLFKGSVQHLFGRRHELSLGYYEFNRSSTKTLTKDIVFQGETYPAQAIVTAGLDTSNLELAYSYFAVRKERFGLGLSFGVVNFDIGSSLDTTIEVSDVTVPIRGRASTTLPIPMVGLKLKGLVHPKIVLAFYGRYLPDTTVDQYSGSSYSASVGVEGLVTDHFRIGASYDGFNVDAKVNDGDFEGRVRWTEQGSMLYLRLVW